MSQEKIDNEIEQFGSLGDIAEEWTPEILPDMSKCGILIDAVNAPYVKTIKYKDEKTGEENVVKKPYIYLVYQKRKLPCRLNKFSQDNLGAAYGPELKGWSGKNVIAIHQEIGNTRFITLKPAGKL